MVFACSSVVRRPRGLKARATGRWVTVARGAAPRGLKARAKEQTVSARARGEAACGPRGAIPRGLKARATEQTVNARATERQATEQVVSNGIAERLGANGDSRSRCNDEGRL